MHILAPLHIHDVFVCGAGGGGAYRQVCVSVCLSKRQAAPTMLLVDHKFQTVLLICASILSDTYIIMF